jgi:BirA family transcriptional regulator, biotin operon repressor / biotin---[acetyl-CoA-carboxylase] ligase
MSRFRIYEFAELDSTNRYACSHLRTLADGDIIHAMVQHAGRGRWERKWISDQPGNLCLSLVLKPEGVPAQLPLAGLAQLLALSTCRVLEAHGQTPMLKWPNDILVNGRKIAGILAESVVQGPKFLGLVLGIGVNLNLKPAALAQIDQPATALNQLVGHAVDVDDFREELLTDFFAHRSHFLRTGFPLIAAEYRRRCPFLGQAITVSNPQEQVSGIARDLTPSGELELELPNGQRRQLAYGEIVTTLKK